MLLTFTSYIPPIYSNIPATMDDHRFVKAVRILYLIYPVYKSMIHRARGHSQGLRTRRLPPVCVWLPAPDHGIRDSYGINLTLLWHIWHVGILNCQRKPAPAEGPCRFPVWGLCGGGLLPAARPQSERLVTAWALYDKPAVQSNDHVPRSRYHQTAAAISLEPPSVHVHSPHRSPPAAGATGSTLVYPSRPAHI